MTTVEVLVPVAVTRVKDRPLAPRLSSLQDKRIAWLDNMKANAGELLRFTAEALAARGHRFEIVTAAKNATAAAPDTVMAHLKTCDAVVLAISDWGSCTSWSVHDSIALETAGIPTAVICSDEFGPLGRAEAQVLGLGALPLLPIPHPLAGNDSALVRAKAEAIADEVLSALTDAPAALAARHAGRFLALTEKRMEGGAVCIDDACVYDPGLAR